MARTWTVVVMPDYRKIAPTGRRFQYGICATGCASRLCAYSTEFPSKPLISYVFDRGDIGGPAVFAAFESVRRGSNVHRMGMLSSGVCRLCPPLQAADLHSWEVHRYFTDQLGQKNPAPRPSFLELLSIPEAGGGGYVFELENLKILFDGIADEERFLQIPINQLNRHSRVILTKRG